MMSNEHKCSVYSARSFRDPFIAQALYHMLIFGLCLWQSMKKEKQLE